MAIGTETAKSGALLIFARLSTRIIDLLSLFVIARALTPGDFGLVAIASSIVTILETALELPVYQILVKIADQRKSHYDTAFTLGALRGILLSLVAVSLALPVSWIYDDSRLTLILCCLGMGPAFRGLSSPRLAYYHKKLSFFRDVLIDITSKSLAFLIAVSVAVSTGSYWAIPLSTVGCAISIAGASYVFAPYRPNLSLSEFHIFFQFMKFSSVSQLISSANWQSERLIVGKMQSSAALGLFTTANDVAAVALNSIFSPIGAPLLAAFSHQTADQEKLRQSYQMASTMMVMIGLPILVGQSVVADLLIKIALGEKYFGSIDLFQWLSISLIPTVFVVASSSILVACDHMNLLVRRHSIEFLIKIPLLLIGLLNFGFVGLIVARIISETCINLYLAACIRKILSLSVSRQFFNSWRIILSVIFMAAAVLTVRRVLMAEDHASSALFELGVSVFTGMFIYVAAIVILWLLVGRPQGAEAAIYAILGKSIHKFVNIISPEKSLREHIEPSREKGCYVPISNDLITLSPARGRRRRRWRFADDTSHYV